MAQVSYWINTTDEDGNPVEELVTHSADLPRITDFDPAGIDTVELVSE